MAARAGSCSAQPMYNSTLLHVETMAASSWPADAFRAVKRAIDAAGREVEPFAQLDRRGAMADAD